MKRHIVGVVLALTAALVSPAALAGIPPQADGSSGLNQIAGVTATMTGDVTAIAVTGSQEPLFTIFRMDNPSRLVVDIAHCSIEGVKVPEVAGAAAVVDIATLQYARGASATGRIVIGLKGGAAYDAKVSGRELVILVAPKGTALPPFTFPGAAKAPAEKPAEPMPVAKAEARPEAKPEMKAGQKPEQKPEAKASAAASAPTAPDYRIKPDPAAIKPVTVTDVRARKVGGDKVEVTFSLDGPAAYGVMEIPNPGRLAFDIPAGKASKSVKKAIELSNAVVSKVRLGVHDDKLRFVMDLPGEMPAYEVKAAGKTITITLENAKLAAKAPAAAPARPIEKAEPAVVKAPADKPAGKPAAPAIAAIEPKKVVEEKKEEKKATATPLAPAVATAPVKEKEPVKEEPAVKKEEKPAAKPAAVEDIAFKQFDGYSRVAIRLSKGADYKVFEADGQTVALEIKDSAIRKEFERTLDVSEISGPVESISSFTDKNRPGTVMVVAKLREKVPARVTAEGGMIHWDFPWTAQMRRDAEVVEYSADKTAGATSTLATATGSGATGKVYKGKRISLDFKEADIHNILRLIAEVSKLNIVTSDDVKGRVTVTLRNVPWDEALDIILQSKGLGKKQVGNIIRVGPMEMFQREAEIELAKKKALRNLEPLYVRLIPVNYGVAGEILTQVKDVLSERGSANIDQRTNVLIVKDMQENVIKAEGLIRNLDTQTPQVLIEARIVEANTTFVRDIGIQWGGTLAFSPATGNQTGLTFPNVVGISGGADDSRTLNPLSGTMSPGGFAVNMPAPVGAGSGGAIGFILGSAGGTANLNLRLSAMENTGDVKILSAPRVTTIDNKEAKIGSGISIPISTVSASGINTVFIEAKLELNVTPHVTQDGSILMKINTTKNEPDFSRTGASGDPTIIKKEASTEVLVKDGDTTVIGGIYTRRNSEEVSKVPLLANIPVIGWLFKKRKVADERTELLIFITPRIINRNQSVVSTK